MLRWQPTTAVSCYYTNVKHLTLMTVHTCKKHCWYFTLTWSIFHQWLFSHSQKTSLLIFTHSREASFTDDCFHTQKTSLLIFIHSREAASDKEHAHQQLRYSRPHVRLRLPLLQSIVQWLSVTLPQLVLTVCVCECVCVILHCCCYSLLWLCARGRKRARQKTRPTACRAPVGYFLMLPHPFLTGAWHGVRCSRQGGG